MEDALLKLPFAIQFSLGSGYAAYALAYRGIRQHHSTSDKVFITIAFGMIAALVMALTANAPLPVGASLGITMTILIGIIWRACGIEYFRKKLRQGDITWSDDSPSAWSVILANNNRPLGQLAVEMQDGAWWICSDTRPFKDFPFGPCWLGANGDVALYATDSVTKDGISKVQTSVIDGIYGDRLTYIPSSQIRTVHFRHMRD